jgi:hypothetical protein
MTSFIARLAACSLVLVACESGTNLQLEVELSDEAAAAGTAAAPALLATDITGGATALVAMCGQDVGTTSFARSVDFSCAGRGDDAEVDVHAWVEPLPDGLDADVFCDLASTGDGIDLAAAVADGGPAVEPSRERALFAGTTTATWRRDISPCGGTLEASVFVE